MLFADEEAVDAFDEEALDELEDCLLVALLLEVLSFRLERNDEDFEVASEEEDDDSSVFELDLVDDLVTVFSEDDSDSDDESEEAELDLLFLARRAALRLENSSYKEGSIAFFFSSSVFNSSFCGLVACFESIDSIEFLPENSSVSGLLLH